MDTVQHFRGTASSTSLLNSRSRLGCQGDVLHPQAVHWLMLRMVLLTLEKENLLISRASTRTTGKDQSRLLMFTSFCFQGTSFCFQEMRILSLVYGNSTRGDYMAPPQNSITLNIFSFHYLFRAKHKTVKQMSYRF